jgi:hypothetical protein
VLKDRKASGTDGHKIEPLPGVPYC